MRTLTIHFIGGEQKDVQGNPDDIINATAKFVKFSFGANEFILINVEQIAFIHVR